MNESIVLTIEKLAGLGDGVAMHEGQRIFVPYTLPGDVARAHITQQSKEAVFAVPDEILTSGQGRVAPVCKHFGTCGGCALQHLATDMYRDFKQQTAREAVRKAGFDPESVGSLISLSPASRRRIELKVADGKLGFYAERSHRLIDIQECKVLEPELEALVLRLKSQLTAQRGLTAVQINGIDGGYDILLHGDGNEKLALAGEGNVVRASVSSRSGLRTLFESAPATVTLGEVKVSVPPGAFLQASREAQALMTNQVLSAMAGVETVLDLFAGIGTYSFPLAAKADVTAIENDAAMVKSMQATVARYELGMTLKSQRRDLFRDPVPSAKLERYDGIVINPPRTGAKEQAAELARAKVKKLVMISCNPATFTRDARLLKEGGYRLVKLVPIDQFVYSPHLEIIAEFTL